MLPRLFHPLLFALFLSTAGYWSLSSQASQPSQGVNVGGSASQPTGLVTPQPQAPEQQVTLPEAELQDVDVMLVIDNSGSMFGRTCINNTPIEGGARDQEQQRIRGAEVVISALAADLKPRNTKLGIVSFGSDAQLIAPLTELSNETPTIRNQLASAIRNPPCEGDTDIAEAMNKALTELNSERGNPANIPAIIFLTDGAPTEPGNGRAELVQLLDGLKTDSGQEVQLFFILLGRTGQDKDLDAFREFWQEQDTQRPNLATFLLDDNNDIRDVYQEIKTQLDQRDHAPNNTPLPSGPMVAVSLPPHVYQVVLTIEKPTVETRLTLTTPAGDDASQLPPDRFRRLTGDTLYEVVIIQRPEPGEWIVSSDNGKDITVLAPEIKSVYSVQLVEPINPALLSVEAANTFAIQVIDFETGTPLAGSYTFNSTFEIENDVDSQQALTLPPSQPDGSTTTDIPARTFIDGQNYLFSIIVLDSFGMRSNPIVYRLPAGRVPVAESLMSSAPRIYVDEPLSLTLTVRNLDSAQGQPLPQLISSLPSGQKPVFRSGSSNTFIADLPPFEYPGTYTLTVSFAGRTLTQTDFNSRLDTFVTVVERPMTIWLRWIAGLIGLIIGLYLLFRYVLLSPLVPVLQRLGIAPQGYIRIQAPGMPDPEGQINLTDVLRRRRKIRRLTLGPNEDIPLALPETIAEDLEDLPPPPKPTIVERLFGKSPLGEIGREFRGDTYIREVGRMEQRNGHLVLRAVSGTRKSFRNDVLPIEMTENQIEYSHKPIVRSDDDSD
jgi:uncharacterized protein YegL